MAQRNTNLVKQAIYDTLKNDVTLVNLLGSATKIRYEKPTKDVSGYPCIVYNLLEEGDQPYNEDFATGISKSLVEIQIFDNMSASSKTIDNIEDRIYTLLHGQKVTGGVSGIESFSCYRVQKTRLPDTDTNVRRIVTAYEYVNYTN